MHGIVRRWVVALTAVVLASPAGAATNPCRMACKAAKQACLQAAGSTFATAKTACAASTTLTGRRSCTHTARGARASARAACRADRLSCIGSCGHPGATTTTTTLPANPSCGDAEPSALSGITQAHNAVRANPSLDSGGVAQPPPNPPLSPLCYSATVASTAQAWAGQCMFKHNANRGSLGENLYATTEAPSATTPTDAVTGWASEAQYFDLASNTCAPPSSPGTCGHYTQVVWRDTTTLGCGVNRCTTNSPFTGFSGWTIVVCDYQPPGNVSLCDAHGNCTLQPPY
jgi:hypothetical protein